MKKMILFALSTLVCLLTLSACSTSSQSSAAGEQLIGTVKTGGSTSVEKVMNALIYQFQNEHRNVTINYEMNGSGDGIKNTISGLYEIGHSSRELKTDGTESGLDAVSYAIDGIAVVVHPNNAVGNLTAKQIKDIYTGKIKNWSEVGGKDALITVVSREASSGTRSAVAELVGLEKKDSSGVITPDTAIVSNATICQDTGSVQTTVSQNPNAIGYISFSDLDTGKVKALQYEGISISTAALKDGSYKLKRDFWLLTKQGATMSDTAKAFIDFVLSDEGQQIVKNNKLLPIE